MQVICYGTYNIFSTCKQFNLLLKLSYNSTVSAGKGEDKDLQLVPHLQKEQERFVTDFSMSNTISQSPLTVPNIK